MSPRSLIFPDFEWWQYHGNWWVNRKQNVSAYMKAGYITQVLCCKMSIKTFVSLKLFNLLPQFHYLIVPSMSCGFSSLWSDLEVKDGLPFETTQTPKSVFLAPSISDAWWHTFHILLFKVFFLIVNSHTEKYTNHKCTTQWILIFSVPVSKGSHATVMDSRNQT